MDRRVPSGIPAQINPAVEVVFKLFQPGAVDGMDHHALAAIGNADNPFTRHRLAAFGAAKGLIGRQADHRALGIDLGPGAGRQIGVQSLYHLARRYFGRA